MISRPLNRFASLLTPVLIFLSSLPGFAWGNEGHIAVNKTAALKIARDMPSFLRKSTDRIAYLGPEPDRWREKSEYALKNCQEPDHYIDLERVDDIREFPQGRYEFYELLYAKRAHASDHADDYLPERVGLQPYITMEIYGRLKAAFRQYRQLKREHKSTAAVEQDIVFYAGWLGHYVADAANPLHTTIHYNGWVGNNPEGYSTSKDIHWKFEGAFVANHLAQLRFDDLVSRPARLADPFHDYIRYLRDSNKLVQQVYEIEKDHGLEAGGSAEAIDFVRHRLAAGAQMLLNLWYSAWEESIEPAPPQVKSVP